MSKKTKKLRDGDPVKIITGPHAGKLGTIVGLIQPSTNLWLVHLDEGGDVPILEEELRNDRGKTVNQRNGFKK